MRRIVDENYIDSYKIILELLKSDFNDYIKSRGACPHVPNSQKIQEVPENSSILRMSIRYDGKLPNRCGAGTCGNCVFRLEEGAEFIDNVKPQEKRKLGAELLKKGYRLGCQTFVTDGDIKISWDEEIRKQVVKRKLDKSQKEVTSAR